MTTHDEHTHMALGNTSNSLSIHVECIANRQYAQVNMLPWPSPHRMHARCDDAAGEPAPRRAASEGDKEVRYGDPPPWFMGVTSDDTDKPTALLDVSAAVAVAVAVAVKEADRVDE